MRVNGRRSAGGGGRVSASERVELDGNIITFEAPSKAAQKTDRPKGRKIEGI